MIKSFDTYYTRTANGHAARPELHNTIPVDVCVIGGGLAGLAVAMGLVERGKSVALLEAQRLGFGASGRNGGFVLAGYAAAFGKIVKRVGAERARELFQLTRDAQGLIRRRIVEHKIDCALVDGHLLASWYDEPAALEAKAEGFRALGVPVELWPRDLVRAVCRTEQYREGLFFPDWFAMHPLNYLLGLADAVEARGGLIFENTEAQSIAEDNGDQVVATSHGAIRACDVVLCGSAYDDGLDAQLARSVLPVSTYVMVTEALPAELLDGAIGAPYCIRDTRWADDYYRRLPDNRLLWGGRVGLGRHVPANLDALMLGDMRKVYPQLRDAKVEAAWGGVMGYTVHKMPHIGRLRDGVWMCTNFGGNGLGPTTAGGEVIASAIAESDRRHEWFAPFGLNWTGGRLGPLVAQGVYLSWKFGDHQRERKLRGA